MERFLRLLLLFWFCAAWPEPSAVQAQTVLFDDFNRVNNTVTGNGWVEVETLAGSSAGITSNQLRLGSTAAGRDYVYRDVSSAYNTVFNTNTGMLTWAFNMRQRRTDPSGFDSGNYGVAFVLGCNSNNFLTGSGYAVVLGNSGSADNLRLVRFVNGIDANANLTNIIAPVSDFGNEYLTVKVTYNPTGNSWSLYIGNNLASFDNPNTAAYTQMGATTSDATYTGTDLLYLGCLWNHATSATDFGDFDIIRIPNLCTLDPEPVSASGTPTFSAIGANSVTLDWTPGGGSSRLIIGSMNGPVNSVPVDGTTYIANSVFGQGTLMAPDEFVVYAGSGNNVTVSGLNPITSYEFRIFEYNGTGCTINYWVAGPATGNMNTIPCIPDNEPVTPSSAPVIVSGLASSMQVAWTRGDGDYCLVICRANTAVTATPADGITYTANTVFGTGGTIAPGEYVVYSGTGNTVTVTGLLSSTSYHFAVFEMNASGCNTNYLVSNPATVSGATSVVSAYNYYFGNLHSHSDYSDGDMDNVCNGANSAYCCFDIGNTAMNFDFMGISDHNHNEGPVMTPAKYASGVSEANNYNIAHNDFVALFGMEWGTLSTGGHVGVYGIDQLIGWNSGNFDVYCAKGDYSTLFNLVNATPNAFATLCHPSSTDFNNLAGSPYQIQYDNAIVGVAIKNGPYNSTNTTYTDPSAGNNLNYYKTLLSKGYHLGPTVDLDNHNSATMGKSSEGRTVVLATSLSKASITDAMLNMRFYATEDYNMNVSFSVNSQYPMGSIVTQTTAALLEVQATDPDGEAISEIKIWYGIPGSNVPPVVLASAVNSGTLNYVHSFATGTFYYFTEITQADGNRSWTSPIWYTKLSSPLPVELLYFTGRHTPNGHLLEWATATELNNDYFSVERSINGYDFNAVGTIKGAGTSLSQLDYQFTDVDAPFGISYYRLKQTDTDGEFTFSRIIALNRPRNESIFQVYPNPNDGSFFINHEFTNGPLSMSVFDATGKQIAIRFERHSGMIHISLSPVARGIYTLQLIYANEVFVHKLAVR